MRRVGWVGIPFVQESGARPDLRHAVLDADRPEREARVERPVEGHDAHCAAVPVPQPRLGLLDEAHGPGLRSARHRHGPGVAQERIQRCRTQSINQYNKNRCVIALPSELSHRRIPRADSPRRGPRCG